MDRYKTITIPSSIEKTDKLSQDLLKEAAQNEYTEKDIFAIHLALEEAFVNAVKHGNLQNPDRQVVIKYEVTPEKFDIFITDDGCGFYPCEVDDPRKEENLCKCSGRGLFLMRSYMDVVEYNEKGNCVHMVKYRKQEDKPSK